MFKVLTEITPLSDSDCFYVVDRRKKVLSFPIHKHDDIELNFLYNAAGARRIVGDSEETIGDEDLVLIGEGGILHIWEQGDCTSEDIREVTIQFSPELLKGSLIDRNQFATINAMLKKARRGLKFSHADIHRAKPILDSIAGIKNGFEQFISFLRLLYILSLSEDAEMLASDVFAGEVVLSDSRRINKLKSYIAGHYAEDLSLARLSGIVGMTPSSLSRFFHRRAGVTLSVYIYDIRIGHAAKELLDSTKTVSEICYGCGFNNISNFNRIFKARRGMTPTEFRMSNKKKGIIV